MNIIKIIIIFLLFLEKAFTAEVVNEIIRSQKQDIDFQNQTRDLESFKTWEKEVKSGQDSKQEIQEEKEGNCFVIHTIKVEGNTALSEKKIAKFKSKYINKNLCAFQIMQIVKELTKVYVNEGYITTQSYIKKQNLNEGILTISVIEGRVEEVIFGSNSLSERITKFMISPLYEEKILNIRDIDQTTENLAIIQSYNYKTVIEAGERQGYSKIYINGSKQFPISINVEFENTGQETTGIYKYGIGANAYNIFSVADAINVKYIATFKNPSQKTEDNYQRTLLGGIDIPFWYTKFGYSVFYSSYFTVINGNVTSFDISGNTLSQNFRFDSLLFRTQKTKTSFGIGMNVNETKSYINGIKIGIQSKQLTDVDFSLTNNFYSKFGSLLLKLSYQTGYSPFTRTGIEEPETDPSDYHLYKFYSFYNFSNNQFIPFVFANQISAQYSKKDLFSFNQFSAGGFTTVRGFDEAGIYGNMGGFTRNDLDFYPFTNGFLGKFNFGMFFDFGVARDEDEQDLHRISSYGFKLNFSDKYLKVSTAFAVPHKHNLQLQKDIKTHFYITANFNY